MGTLTGVDDTPNSSWVVVARREPVGVLVHTSTREVIRGGDGCIFTRVPLVEAVDGKPVGENINRSTRIQ